MNVGESFGGGALQFIDVLRKIVINTVESTKPVKIMYGTVTCVSPIEIKLDAKITLPEACLILPDYLQEKVFWTEEEIPVRVTLPSPIQLGSRVIILREQQGQKFLLLGVVA